MENDKHEFYWQRVIRHFEIKGYIQNGLTIPFLVGVRRIVEPQKALLSIEYLINELSLHGCTMLRCRHIGEYVVGSLDAHTKEIGNLYHCIGNIIVTDDSLVGINDTLLLTARLKKLYKMQIDLGQYSKNNGVWSDFTQTDMERFQEVIRK